jgi:hypothetical protein
MDDRLLNARDNKDQELQRGRREAKKRFDAKLKKRSRIPDEEFILETEVSEERGRSGLLLFVQVRFFVSCD